MRVVRRAFKARDHMTQSAFFLFVLANAAQDLEEHRLKYRGQYHLTIYADSSAERTRDFAMAVMQDPNATSDDQVDAALQMADALDTMEQLQCEYADQIKQILPNWRPSKNAEPHPTYRFWQPPQYSVLMSGSVLL